MKRTTYTIFDSYDVTSDENMKEARENLVENMFWDSDENDMVTVTDNYGKEVKLTREEYSKSLTDEKIYDECYFMNETWFDDEKWELKHVSEGEVIAIANLGR